MDIKFRAEMKTNKLVRFFALPYVRVRNKRRVERFQKSEDSQYLKSLKNIHENESCFIVGNGPSLLAEDLDKIKAAGIVCFGANRIYHIFKTTSWRPTYYLCLDTNWLEIDLENIRRIGDFPKFINYECLKKGRTPKDQIHYLCSYRDFFVDPLKLTVDTMSRDPSLFSQKTSTVTANAIELAVYMGFKIIYLIGVDNNYKLKRVNGKIYEDPSVSSSYFGQLVENGPYSSVQDVDYMNMSYVICKNFAEENGVKIFNATRGGKLETFERVDFDELMKKVKREDMQ